MVVTTTIQNSLIIIEMLQFIIIFNIIKYYTEFKYVCIFLYYIILYSWTFLRRTFNEQLLFERIFQNYKSFEQIYIHYLDEKYD